MTGLTNGTAYSLSLKAANAVGSSIVATSSGTPVASYAPSAPQQFSAVPGAGGAVNLSWQAPADDGGSAITGYTITYQRQTLSGTTWSPAAEAPVHSFTAAGSATTVVASAFETQQAFYAFTLTATNGVGMGAAAAGQAPVTPSVATKSGTVTLTADTLAKLSHTDDGSLAWPDPAPAQVTSLVVGSIVAAAPAALLPQGTLRTVTGVNDDGTTLTLSTSTAGLGDAFTAMSLAANLNPASPPPPTATAPTNAATSEFEPATPGVRVLPSVRPNDIGAGVGVAASVRLALNYKANGVYVTAQASVIASVDLQVNVRQGFLGVPNGVSIQATGKAVTSVSGAAGVKGTYSRKLGEFAGAPIDFQIGPVPVVVVPKIVITFSASGQIGVSFEATQTTGAALSWDSSQPGNLTARNITTGPRLANSPIPGLTATGSLDIGIQVQPQADLYDIGGPNVEADVDLKTDVNFIPAPSEAFLTTVPSITLKVGLDLDILGKHASLEKTVGNWSYPAFTINAPPNAAYTITPVNGKVNLGSQLQLTAQRSDSATPPVTWGILGGTSGDRITSGGVFTPSAPAVRGVIITATDSTGATGQVAVTVGIPFDPVGNLQASQTQSQDSNAGLGMTLSWSPPANTGGQPLSGYRIVTQPSTGATSTGNSGVEFDHLRPGTYSVTVYAVNGAGIASAPASTSVYITPRCSSTWNGPDNGNWATATNWLPAGVPGDGSWVCLQGHPVTIAKNTNAAVAGLLGGGASLATSGSLTVGSYATGISALSGTGKVTFAAGSSATLSAVTLDGATLVNKGTLAINSACGYACGYFGLCLRNGSQLDNQATLTLAANTSILDGDGNTGTKVTNEAGATINVNDGSQITPALTNAGTITITTGTLTLPYATLTSSSVINGAGTAQFGDVSFAAGTAPQLPKSTIFTGRITGPNLTFAAGTSTSFSGATIPVSLTFASGSTATFSAAAVSAAVTFAAGSSATLSAVTLDGATLVNKGTLAINSACGYACGYFGLCLRNGSQLDNQATLTLAANTSILDGDGNTGTKVTNEAGATINVNDGSQITPALTNAGTITITTGTLTLPYATLTSSSVINGAGTAQFGDVSFAAGTAPQLPKSTIFTGRITGPNLTFAAGTSTSFSGATIPVSLTFASGSTATFSAAAVSAAVTFAAGSSATLSAVTLDGATLVNKGTLAINSACGYACGYFGLCLRNGSQLDNQATLTLAANTSILDGDGNTGTKVTNEAGATINVNDGSQITPALTNAGTITITTGTLTLPYATLTSSSVINGAGTAQFGDVSFAAGTAPQLPKSTIFTGRITGPNLTFAAGTSTSFSGATIPVSLTFASGSTATFSAAAVSAAVTFAAGSSATLSAVTLDGATLVNKGTLAINSACGYACGYFGLCLRNGSQLDNQATLTLAANTSILDGDGNTGTKVTNEAGATINVNDGSQITPALTNAGTITITTGTLTLPYATLTSSSVINGAGTAQFGDVSFAAGTAPQLPKSTIFTGRITGPNLTFAAGTSTSFSGATIPVSLTFASGSTATFSAAAVSAAVTFAAGSSATLSAVTLDGATLVNKGTLAINSACGYACGYFGLCLRNGSQLDNQATLTLAANTSILDGDGNTGTKVTNEAGATINVNDGSQITPALTNAGTITITTGTLTLPYATLTNSSTLALGIDGASNGAVNFGTPVRLAGTLAIKTSTGYTPVVGRTVALINDPSGLTGTFAKVTGAKVGLTSWKVAYGSTVVTAKAAAS